VLKLLALGLAVRCAQALFRLCALLPGMLTLLCFLMVPFVCLALLLLVVVVVVIAEVGMLLLWVTLWLPCWVPLVAACGRAPTDFMGRHPAICFLLPLLLLVVVLVLCHLHVIV
jgi:hypothetical protein